MLLLLSCKCSFLAYLLWTCTVNTGFIGRCDTSRETLVFLHPLPEHSAAWLETVAALRDAGFRMVLPDLRGCGMSSIPEGGKGTYSWKNQLEDIKALVTSTEVQTGETSSLNASAAAGEEGEEEEGGGVSGTTVPTESEEKEKDSSSLYPSANTPHTTTTTNNNNNNNKKRVWLVGAREGGFWAWLAAALPAVATHLLGIVVINSPHPVWVAKSIDPSTDGANKAQYRLYHYSEASRWSGSHSLLREGFKIQDAAWYRDSPEQRALLAEAWKRKGVVKVGIANTVLDNFSLRQWKGEGWSAGFTSVSTAFKATETKGNIKVTSCKVLSLWSGGADASESSFFPRPQAEREGTLPFAPAGTRVEMIEGTTAYPWHENPRALVSCDPLHNLSYLYLYLHLPTVCFDRVSRDLTNHHHHL